MHVLVTGATGFVGHALVPMLKNAGHKVTIAVRNNATAGHLTGVHVKNIVDIGPTTNWLDALTNIDAIIHLAGRAHVMAETSEDAVAAYRHINVEGTRQLAQAASDIGIKRMVFLSSVKVNGERTGDHPFNETMSPNPEDAYGRSKLEGEQALLSISAKSSLEPVIVRTPLVYGSYVKGNFLSLLRICAKNLPLPLGGLTNRRSLIYVKNLADVLIQCLTHTKADGKLYLVSDGESLSTAPLIKNVAFALGKMPQLFSFPKVLLKAAGLLTGKNIAISRLTESLEVNDFAIRRDLGWTPPFTMVQGLSETAGWFKALK